MLPSVFPSSVSIVLLIITTQAFPSSIIPCTGVCFFENVTYLPIRLPGKANVYTQQASSLPPTIVNAIPRKSSTFAYQVSALPAINYRRNQSEKRSIPICRFVAPLVNANNGQLESNSTSKAPLFTPANASAEEPNAFTHRDIVLLAIRTRNR